MTKKLLVLFGVVVLIMAAGCTRAGTKDEEVAAIDYLDAVLRNDANALDGLICGATPDGSASQDLLSLWAIGLAVKAAGPAFDAEGLKVDVIARRTGGAENEAEVLMRGNIEIPAELEPSDQMPLPADNVIPLDETWRMVSEDGVWKWCGGVSQE
jgi:hypothetical protein